MLALRFFVDSNNLFSFRFIQVFFFISMPISRLLATRSLASPRNERKMNAIGNMEKLLTTRNRKLLVDGLMFELEQRKFLENSFVSRHGRTTAGLLPVFACLLVVKTSLLEKKKYFRYGLGTSLAVHSHYKSLPVKIVCMSFGGREFHNFIDFLTLQMPAKYYSFVSFWICAFGANVRR